MITRGILRSNFCGVLYIQMIVPFDNSNNNPQIEGEKTPNFSITSISERFAEELSIYVSKNFTHFDVPYNTGTLSKFLYYITEA